MVTMKIRLSLAFILLAALPLAACQPASAAPVGIVVQENDQDRLTFYSADGEFLGERNLPLIDSRDFRSNLHILGSFREPSSVPLIYATTNFIREAGPYTVFHFQADEGDLGTTLLAISGFPTAVSAPGESVVLFVENEVHAETSIDVSYLVERTHVSIYLFDAADQGEPQLVYSVDMNGAWMTPLAVEMRGDEVVGFWYTPESLALRGGSISRGLGYINVSEGASSTVLFSENSICSISLDHQWVVFFRYAGEESSFYIHNMTSGEEQALPAALPYTADLHLMRFAISPANQSVVWNEISADFLDENDHLDETRVNAPLFRVASLDGTVIQDFPISMFMDYVSSDNGLFYFKLIGWLDDQTVLVQAYGTQEEDDGSYLEGSAILKLDVTTGAVTEFAPGTFVDFLYP